MNNVVSRIEKKQKRSIQTEAQLLWAAEALFAKRGYQDTKITEIIETAKVSTGSFYHHFKDKQSLAETLINRFIEETQDEIDALDLSIETHGTIDAMLLSLANTICDEMDRRLGVYRASNRINSSGDHARANTASLVMPLIAKVIAQLPDYRAQIKAADAEQATKEAMQLIILILWQTRLGGSPMFPKDRNQLIQMAVKAARALLE